MSGAPDNPYKTKGDSYGPGDDPDDGTPFPIGGGRHQRLRQPAGHRFAIPMIAGGLTIWGGLLAIGASMGPQQHDLRRLVFVASFVAAFLAAWGLLIAGRRWTWFQRYAAWSCVAVSASAGFVYLAGRYQARREEFPQLSDAPRQMFFGLAIALVAVVVLAPIARLVLRRR